MRKLILSDRHPDPKTDYLMRCFRNTVGKDRENYVILGVWNRLRKAGFDIKPVTQQYVRKPHRGYALLDLYFPSIHFAVECDEAYHLKNKKMDELRDEEIVKAFAKCGIKSVKKNVSDLSGDLAVDADSVDPMKLQVARIDASLSYQEVDRQLDRVAKIICARTKACSEPLWDTRTPAEIVAARGGVSVSNPVVFSTIPEILNAFKIFKPNGDVYKSWWKGAYRLRGNDDMTLWFPHLAYDAGGWKNKLLPDGETIEESREVGRSRAAARARKIAKISWTPLVNRLREGILTYRIVFAHSKDSFGEVGYRFKGVFVLDGARFSMNEHVPTTLIWHRCENEFRRS